MGIFSSLFGSNDGSQEAADLAQENLAWVQGQAGADWNRRSSIARGLQPYRDYADGIDKQVVDSLMASGGTFGGYSKDLWDRYINKAAPVEDQFYQDAANYGGLADQNRAAGEAVSDVRQQAGIQQQMTNRNLASMGVNPNSARFNSGNRVAELAAMAAAAGGATKARQAQRDKGIELRGKAAELGQGLLRGAGSFGELGVKATGAASDVAGQGFGRGLQVGKFRMDGMPQYVNGVNSAVSTATNALQNTNTTGLVPGLLGFGASALTAPSTSIVGKWLT